MAYLGDEILPTAREKIGQDYVLGARAPLLNPNWNGPWDCAEFASWCAYKTYRIVFGVSPQDPRRADAYSGFWWDQSEASGLRIGVAEALATPGAFLLRRARPGLIGHVAICTGNGGLIEAAGARIGVVERPNSSDRRWDGGALLPGVEYAAGVIKPLPPGPATLRLANPYMRGEAVVRLQKALLKRGYDPGPVDGIFGEMTEAAVAAFQRVSGLVVDGDVGPQTASLLLDDAHAGG